MTVTEFVLSQDLDKKGFSRPPIGINMVHRLTIESTIEEIEKAKLTP